MKPLYQAINATCHDCIYDPQGGLDNWRQQVVGCTVETCPLFTIWPVSHPVQSTQRDACSTPTATQEKTAQGAY